ncbi:hypothetical protein JNUCC64_16130 [Streptomyces sp. JNUCC 64]
MTHVHGDPGAPGSGEPSGTLTDRLAEWARGRNAGERAAVAALVAERDVLARPDVRDLLVVDTGTRAHCDWARFETHYRESLELDHSERAFLDLVMAIRFPRLVPLWLVENLGERRLAVFLRALAAVVGADGITVAVGVTVSLRTRGGVPS